MIIAGKTKKDREKTKKVVNKLVKGSSYFDDGYQVGDVTKTILATGGNALSNIGKGFIGTTEGVADALTTTFGDLTQKSAKAQASIWELFGNDDYAESLRQAGSQVKKASYENAKADVTSSIFDSTEALNATKYLLGDKSAVNKKDVNWSEDLNKKSVAGELLQSAEQGIGNIGAFVGLGALTGGSTAGTFATSFASSYGSTLTNDLRNGASEKEAKGHAISSGLAEAISEQFFQGIPGLNQAGWADNLVGNSVQKYFGTKAGKVALKIFDSAGEGFEEVISNMLEATFEGIRNGKSVGEIFDDASAQSFFNNEQTRDAFWSAVISSAITNGASNLISNQQKQSVLKAYAEENNISTKQAQELFDSLVEKKSNLEDTKNFKEQVETQEGIEQGLINELRQAQNDGQQVDLNELLNQTPNSRQEMQFTLDQDEVKNIKSDKQKVLADDMARLNNVKENHELFKTVNAIQGANSTQQYHITTTEGLYEMGIVNKDANGNYTMPDGSPYVPRGLNYKDGDIYINADVGNQSGTQAMYHEMFEGFKKASPSEYNEFKQMVTDIIGEENIQKEYDTYKSMYGEELTDDIRDEIINDKFGELAESEQFINKIADNRTLLQKFIDTIKDMINYVKGTEQEKELIKLQRNLEKEFAKRYKATDFSGNKGETAYSMSDKYMWHSSSQENIDNIRRYGFRYDKESSYFATNDDISKNYGADKIMLEQGKFNLKDVTQELEETDNRQLARNTAKEEGYDGIKYRTSKDNYDIEITNIDKLNEVVKQTEEENAELIKALMGETDTKYSLTKDNGIQTINDYINTNNYTFNNNGVLTVSNLTDKQIKDLVKIYHTTGYEDVSTDYLVNRLKEGNMPLQREVADRFIEKELGYKPTIDTTQVFEDAEGNPLTKEQIEFYKDSAVRDIRGRLIPVYHRTNAEFTEFDSKAGTQHGKKYGKGFYFSTTPENYGNNTMKLYLNAKEGEFKYIPKMGYYIVQNPNQIKNVNNKAPTSSNDIRYSLTKDNTGRELSEGQRDYFKDVSPKLKDDNGNIKVLYHGTKNDFNIFDTSKFGNQNGTAEGFGIYLTDNKTVADDYGDRIIESYAKIINPASTTELTTTKQKLVNAIRELSIKEAQQFVDDGDYDNINDALKDTWISNYTYTYDKSIEQSYNEVADTILNSSENDFEVMQELMNGSGNNDYKLADSFYDTITNTLGFDGIYTKWDFKDNDLKNKNADIFIAFRSNQVKNIDNLNPTEDADIRYSMTSNENIDSKEIAPTGSTIQNELAPIKKDLSNITEQMKNLSNQIETLQNELETTPGGYVETYNEQRNENIPTRQLTEEDANTLQDALMNDEGYLKSLDEQANLNTENTKLIDRLTNNVTERLGLERGQRETLRGIIKESVENGYSTDEISEALQREFSQINYEMTNDEAVEMRKLIRDIPINVSDAIKTDIADYGKWKQSNFGKINFSKSGGAVDAVYAELSEISPAFFPSDIVNPTDQLLRISEVANTAKTTTETIDIDADEFDSIADYIKNTTLQDEYNAQMQRQYDLDKNIQFNMVDEIAPTTIRTQESIDDYIENRDIAPVRQDIGTRRNNSPLRDRLETIRRSFGEMITNRNYVIDETAKATGNRQIKFAGDMLNSVSGEAQYNVNNKQTDMNGNVIGKSVTEIFEPSKKAGLYEAFNDYLVQKSNIERHRVGKGSQVPEVVSQQLVKMYENENPQFKEWAKDVYKYFDNVLQEQVDAGLITQEQFNNYRGEDGIYRSYVPFYEGEIDNNRFFDSDGNVKPVSTLKRSTGNATDVNQLLAVEDSMAKQTYAYKRAIRQNELYKEIVNSLDKYSDAMDMDLRDNPTNLNDVLYATPEGDKILSAYVDGEKTSAKISDELYNELSGDNEARIRQLEDDFSLITNPLQKVSNVRRNILTSWNPTFLARNAIKDIQDAVINSKHTGDMLKNYFGLKQGQKSAVFELREGKTKEAQQFLALYGADNLYGDYSNANQNKGLINKFARANELIELAPRFAEFKASLQNGESVQEAIYNAREVTTNFGRGGYITKALNRNGFTFLNANVQGLDKLVRNLSGENGVKGVTSVVAKGAVFAVLPSILNELLYGVGDDKDEEYEALPDYVKDNYYLIKTEGNNFVRIPKGRINASFGSLARRTINAVEGDENAYEGALSNAWDQIGVGDLGGNNIFSPLIQAFGSENGEAWYGGDIVPTRLQDKPASEQTDAKIDAISNAIGELFGVSPYKVNYVLDQYTGGAGDILLPMITPETKSGAEKPHEYLLAPIKDAFVVNSTDDNKYAGEFYNLKDKLEIQSNSSKATDDDKIRYKYMSNISKEMSELYKERREVQADTTLGNKEKYAKVQAIQNEINALAKEGISNYQNATTSDNYSNINDSEYYKDSEGEWKKVTDDESEFTAGLNQAEKDLYFKTKNKIGGITKEYTSKTKDLDKDDPKKKQYSAERKENITQAIVNSGLDNYTKAMVYSKYYSDKDNMTNVVNAGYNVDTYITALNDIEQLRDKYSKDNGYTTEQRKQKTIAYINSLDMEIPQKAMLIRNYYTSFRDYNNEIVNYVSNLNLTQDEKVQILKGTGMTVNGNTVSWK